MSAKTGGSDLAGQLREALVGGIFFATFSPQVDMSGIRVPSMHARRWVGVFTA